MGFWKDLFGKENGDGNEERDKKSFSELFQSYPPFVRDIYSETELGKQVSGFGDDAWGALNHLMTVVEKGKELEYKAMLEKVGAIDLEKEAVAHHQRLRPELLLYRIKRSSNRIYLKPYGEEAQVLHSEGRVSTEDLEGAVEALIENEAEEGFKRIMNGVYPDHCVVEDSVAYALQHEIFTMSQRRKIESRLDMGETIDEYMKLYGIPDLQKQIVSRLLSKKEFLANAFF